MTTEIPGSARRSRLLPYVVTLLLLAVAWSESAGSKAHAAASSSDRSQLSIGYSLLYQQADLIPKLGWLLVLKKKTPEMAQVSGNLLSYYKQLADTMRRLSKQYPAMRIDLAPTSGIEWETRKAVSLDLVRDMAPVVGQSGIDFEREALLAFYSELNNQAHLVGVMMRTEDDSGLSHFLAATQSQLQARRADIAALLNRRYFTH